VAASGEARSSCALGVGTLPLGRRCLPKPLKSVARGRAGSQTTLNGDLRIHSPQGR
jgi:hypothetical protein